MRPADGADDDWPAGPTVVRRARTLSANAHAVQQLNHGWRVASVPPGSITAPDELQLRDEEWRAAIVPGTVASSVRAADGLDLETAPDFDANDWWYRCEFEADVAGERAAARDVLCFDGLATLADVWLNGALILSSENMFVAHEVDVTSDLAAKNALVIRFRSLRHALQARRPRPRWRTKLVEHQQLRWHRTTLLGRMPGWSPPVRAVGPWRPIRLERRAIAELLSGDITPRLDGDVGVVDAALVVHAAANDAILRATLTVGDHRADLALQSHGEGSVALHGTLALPNAEPWWPHTHGTPARYDASLLIETERGAIAFGLGKLAFRSVHLDTANDGFSLAINGETIFCRGACWTTPDIVSLAAPEETYRTLLTLARDAGMNMIRIGGTMVYEADCFYDLCDELGIMVWQDFMFANMDYPAGDASFSRAVRDEAECVVARLRRHPSVVLYCGNSEVEQQAAMLGLEPALWSNAIFRELLPEVCASFAGDVPYWPASPSGGALPFHVDAGVAHYYGVGAYLRPLEDARRANVRFTSECLGFSNVPEPETVDALLPNGEAPFHHPRWKARVPRDHGAGWDFEDVRDHYLQLLFGVDPMRLRYSDRDRYLALSRVVTGEVIARTIGEWRRAESTCRGAIVWFYQDLWLGAGWGVVDAAMRPKAAYYIAKRAMQPVAIAITDEGNNGLSVSIANDLAAPFDGELTITLVRGASTIVANAATQVHVAARSAGTFELDAMLGRFYDPAYAFRFGPPGHDVVAATLRDGSGTVVGETFHFPLGLPTAVADELGLVCEARQIGDSIVEITLSSTEFAQSLWLDCGEYRADDNYFHLVPGSKRAVLARAKHMDATFNGFVQPLNAREGARIVVVADAIDVPAGSNVGVRG